MAELATLIHCSAGYCLALVGNTFCEKNSEIIPTESHMTIVEMLNKDYVQNIVTESTDGLFYRAGITDSKLVELNWNAYKQTCKKCYQRFLRDSKDFPLR